ncbi:MAG: methionine aminopeptidase [Pontimonas sp.]|nr:methionine aminopeptidase [Pontimonas sp.]MCF8547914.1 methionine aminopeptidase [Pontimonas sp.]
MAEPEQWWYNHKTGQVEKGRHSLGLHRDGPFASEEAAARAPEIARERSREWEQEETNP